MCVVLNSFQGEGGNGLVLVSTRREWCFYALIVQVVRTCSGIDSRFRHVLKSLSKVCWTMGSSEELSRNRLRLVTRRRGKEAIEDRDVRLSDLQSKMEELSREKVRAVEDSGSEVASLELKLATAIKDNGGLLRRNRCPLCTRWSSYTLQSRFLRDALKIYSLALRLR